MQSPETTCISLLESRLCRFLHMSRILPVVVQMVLILPERLGGAAHGRQFWFLQLLLAHHSFSCRALAVRLTHIDTLPQMDRHAEDDSASRLSCIYLERTAAFAFVVSIA